MALALGHKGGHFGFGEEGTWGGADTITHKLKLRRGGDSVVKTVDEILSEEIPNFYTDDSESVIGNIAVAGGLVYSSQYEGHELLYKHALGNLASVQPDVTGDADTWQHTYTMVDALPTGLTFEIDMDTHEKVVEGGKINRIEWAIDVNGLLICTINIVGEDIELTTSPTGALSFPTAAYIKYQDQPTGGYVVKYNNGELPVTGLSWYLDNALDVDRRHLGSNLIKEPQRSGKVECGGSFTIEFDATTEYDDFVAQTARTLVIQFDGAAIAPGENYNYMEKFSFDAIKFRAVPLTVDDEGRIQVACEWKAFAADASNLELEILTQNEVDDTYDTA